MFFKPMHQVFNCLMIEYVNKRLPFICMIGKTILIFPTENAQRSNEEPDVYQDRGRFLHPANERCTWYWSHCFRIIASS